MTGSFSWFECGWWILWAMPRLGLARRDAPADWGVSGASKWKILEKLDEEVEKMTEKCGEIRELWEFLRNVDFEIWRWTNQKPTKTLLFPCSYIGSSRDKKKTHNFYCSKMCLGNPSICGYNYIQPWMHSPLSRWRRIPMARSSVASLLIPGKSATEIGFDVGEKLMVKGQQ